MFQRYTDAQGYRGQGFAGLLGGSFLTGIWMGLGALPLLFSADFSLPRYRSDGIAGDWEAVGSYLNRAMGRFDDDDDLMEE